MNMELVYCPLSGESIKVTLEWDGCVAAGYTGRDRESVLAHIEELKQLGVKPPQKVPATYWIDPLRVTTSSKLYVVGDYTSGEVEFFIASDKSGELFVTVGSDHTDRELERISVSKAKQICTKVIASCCWKLSDIKDHWDELILKMEVKSKDKEETILYQEGSLSLLLPPDELIDIVLKDKPLFIKKPSIFGGTIPLWVDEVIYAPFYKLYLIDPVLDREISCSYEVVVLQDKLS